MSRGLFGTHHCVQCVWFPTYPYEMYQQLLQVLTIYQYLQKRYQQKRKQSVHTWNLYSSIYQRREQAINITSKNMRCQVIINVIKRYKTQLLPKTLTIIAPTLLQPILAGTQCTQAFLIITITLPSSFFCQGPPCQIQSPISSLPNPMANFGSHFYLISTSFFLETFSLIDFHAVMCWAKFS